MYKPNDVVYIDTGDFEFVVVIDSIDNKDYIIRNGIYREKENHYPDMIEHHVMYDDEAPIVISDYKESEFDMPLIDIPQDIIVPEWKPISLIYPYYEDPENFDREPLDEITRMATIDEGEALMKVVGFYTKWNE